jgi:8-amino-7-oxononanoate synthase
MDIFEKCWKFTRATEARQNGYYPYYIPIQGSSATEVIVDGKKKVMIGSNNYLGLTHHPKILAAAQEAMYRYGTGCTGSRFLNGTLDLHEELERKLAKFTGFEDCLVFSTGFQTNLGIIDTLLGKNDVVIVDKLAHASIVDACRLSYGETFRFRHNDPEDLERVLKKANSDRGKLVVVEGIYSMEGDIACLPNLIEVANRYEARVMVDDAHALGVLGDGGRGTADHFNLQGKVDLVMGTFSKSFACIGGFVAGEERVIDYIKHHARTLIFSASMPPSAVATVLVALEVMQDEKDRIESLWQNARKMWKGFQDLGYDIGGSESPVVPVILGDDMITFSFWRKLMDAGIFSNPVISPAVPEKAARLRTSYIATHTEDQLDFVLETFKKIGKEEGII